MARGGVAVCVMFDWMGLFSQRYVLAIAMHALEICLGICWIRDRDSSDLPDAMRALLAQSRFGIAAKTSASSERSTMGRRARKSPPTGQDCSEVEKRMFITLARGPKQCGGVNSV